MANFFEDILFSLNNCIQYLNGSSEDLIQVVVTRLESILTAIAYERELNNLHFPEAIEKIIAEAVYKLTQDSENVIAIGRPKFRIPSQQLEYLLSMGFKATEIAQFFGVSKETIFRRLRELGLSIGKSYTNIGDEALQLIVKEILMEFPNTGYKRMKGYLLSKEIRVTDFRVREVMRIVDPMGVYQRTHLRNRTIRRRQYNVQYSNQLWHIDGNLKLIRWGFVIRCGIDGKSRMVTYISATSDNRADTHLPAFMNGVQQYGVPWRTRSDKGGENVLIAKYMIETRGCNRRSHICGRSVHNQRIEKFWREVYEGCIWAYRNLFSKLEEDNIFVIDNEKHIFVLHYIFLPRMNDHLQKFIHGWNNHPLSSEGNHTPNRIFISNLPPPSLDILPTQDELQDAFFYCNDMNDLEQFENDSITNLSLNDNSLNSNEMEVLRNINPMQPSNAFGYDIFSSAIQSLRL